MAIRVRRWTSSPRHFEKFADVPHVPKSIRDSENCLLKANKLVEVNEETYIYTHEMQPLTGKIETNLRYYRSL